MVNKPFFKCLKLIPFFIYILKGSVFAETTHIIQVIEVVNEGAKKAKFEYRISLAKNTFLLNESIKGEVWVKNISSTPVRTYYPRGGWVIIDEPGKKIQPSFSSSFQTGPLELRPGDSLGGPFDLSQYGISLRGNSAYDIGFIPGEYKAYFFRDTTPFIFNVIEPTNDESEALKILFEAHSLFDSENFPALHDTTKLEQFTESVKKLISLADRYPNSVYAVQALVEARVRLWNILHNHDLAHQITQRMIREYPYVGVGYLHSLKIYYQEKDDFTSYKNELENIIKRNAHPKLTAVAKVSLKNAKEEFYHNDKKTPPIN